MIIKYKETSTTVTGLIECHHSADAKNVIGQISIDPENQGDNPVCINDKQESLAVSNPSKGITFIYKRVVNNISLSYVIK